MVEKPRMSDTAVRARTGKDWAEWFDLLDRAGAGTMTHREIVACVGKAGVGPWWQQMVAVTYEQARGLRAKHEKPEGFEIGRTRTIAAPAAKLYRAFADPRSRARWLKVTGIQIRTATPDKALRLAWGDGTVVVVALTAKGEEKTQVNVQHGKLPDQTTAERMKAWWGEKLDTLAAQAEGA